jgi:hypothetical protein
MNEAAILFLIKLNLYLSRWNIYDVVNRFLINKHKIAAHLHGRVMREIFSGMEIS